MRILFLIIFVFNSQYLHAGDVYYSVDPNDPYAPAVKTSKPDDSKCCYLTAPSMDVTVKTESSPKSVATKPSLKITEQKHQLKPLAIGGLLRNPRVQFNQAGYQFKPLGTKIDPPYKTKVFDNTAADQF